MVVMMDAADVFGKKKKACQRTHSTLVFSSFMVEKGLRWCCVIEAKLWPSCPELHNCEEQVIVLCCPDVT